MRSCSTFEREGSAARVHVGPVTHEDGVAVQEDRVGLVLLVAGYGNRGNPPGHHAARGLEPRYGLRRGDDHLVDTVGGQHATAGVPDKLQAVDDAALVLRPLEDEAVPGATVAAHLGDHLLHLVPRLGRIGEAGLLEEILPVVEQPRVGEPRDAVDPSFVGVGVHGGRQVRRAEVCSKEIGEIGDPAFSGELRGPDHVAAYDVGLGLAGLELDTELLEVLVRVSRRQAQRYLYSSLVSLVEALDLVPQDLGVLPVREDEPDEALALLSRAPSHPE
jgi:hypothetical protein